MFGTAVKKNECVVSHKERNDMVTVMAVARKAPKGNIVCTIFSSQMNFIQFYLCNNLSLQLLSLFGTAAVFQQHLHPKRTRTKCVRVRKDQNGNEAALAHVLQTNVEKISFSFGST